MKTKKPQTEKKNRFLPFASPLKGKVHKQLNVLLLLGKICFYGYVYYGLWTCILVRGKGLKLKESY